MTAAELAPLRDAGPVPSTSPYPDGTWIRDERGRVLLIHGTSRLGPRTPALAAVAPPSDAGVPTVPESTAGRYPEATFRLPDGLLVADGAGVALVSGGQRRPLTDEAAVQAHGYADVSALELAAAQLAGTPLGPALTAEDNLADGAAVRTPSGALWLVDGGVLEPVTDAMLASRGLASAVAAPDPAMLEGLGQSDVLAGFRDGALIQPADEPVYVVSRGQRHAIRTGEAFAAMGLRADMVRPVTADEAAAHPVGDPIG